MKEAIKRLQKEVKQAHAEEKLAHESFGFTLKVWRTENKKLSLRALAKIWGVSAAHLSDIERGNRHASEHLLARITKI